jgi:hypothetical protein
MFCLVAYIYPHLTPLQHPPMLPLLMVVLYVPPHQRSLPTKDRQSMQPVPANALGTGNKRLCCVGDRLLTSVLFLLRVGWLAHVVARTRQRTLAPATSSIAAWVSAND